MAVVNYPDIVFVPPYWPIWCTNVRDYLHETTLLVQMTAGYNNSPLLPDCTPS